MFRSQFVGSGSKPAGAASVASSKSSRAQPKRVRFGSDSVVSAGNGSQAETDVTSSSMSISSFVREAKRALRRRPDDYREFAAAVGDILRANCDPKDRGTGSGRAATTVDVIGRIERIVLLLDGHPNLTAGLSSILPPGFSIDIQRDAVVVKVCEADGDYSMVDTGHCSVDTGHCRAVEHPGTKYPTAEYRAVSPRMRRPTSRRTTSAANKSPNIWEAFSSSELFPWTPGQRAVRRPDLPTTDRQLSTATVGGVFSSGAVSRGDSRNRPRSSPSRQRRAVTSSTTLSRRPSHLRRTASRASASVAQPSVSVAVLRQMQSRQQQQQSAATSKGGRRSMSCGSAYIYEVKKALSRHPDVYQKFIGIVKRYHDQRTGGGSSSGTTSSQSSVSRRYDDSDATTATPSNEDDVDVDDENELGPTAGELETIREVVTLLRNRPQLVLAFNDFLPDGYRIRMFDESAYVIEYPCTFAVSGAGGISASIGRLTVAV